MRPDDTLPASAGRPAPTLIRRFPHAPPDRRDRQDEQKERRREYPGRINQPVGGRQLPRQNLDEMDQGVPHEKDRQADVYRAAAPGTERTPAEAESRHEVGDADVADEVGVERAGVRDGRGEMRLPREGGGEHPRPVDEAEEAEDGVEDF